MTMKQIANRTLTHWKIVLLLVGLGVTGSIAASGLSHLLKDVQIRQVQLQGELRYLDADQLMRDLSLRFNGNYLDTTLGSPCLAGYITGGNHRATPGGHL